MGLVVSFLSRGDGRTAQRDNVFVERELSEKGR